MQSRLWIVLLSLLVAGLVSSGVVAYFIDSAQNANDSFATAASWSEPALLDDGFEGDPWDANWDDNGNTSWQRASNQVHSGSWSALCDQGGGNPITTDDLGASSARWIQVNFWFRPVLLDEGDILVQIYNGSTYNTWYDITNYPSYASGQWCYFSEYITDSQYFKSNFSLRLDGAGLIEGTESFYLDDVLIYMLTVP